MIRKCQNRWFIKGETKSGFIVVLNNSKLNLSRLGYWCNLDNRPYNTY